MRHIGDDPEEDGGEGEREERGSLPLHVEDER